MTPFQEWLERQISATGQARILARRIGVEDSAIHAWLYRGILPAPRHEAKLSDATGENLETIAALVDRSWRQQRAELDERRQRRVMLAAPEVAASGQFRPKEGFTTGGIAAVVDPKGSRAGQRTRPITRKSVKLAEKRRTRRILLSWPGWPLAA